MKYMLLIYADEQALSETERQDCYQESTQLARDLHANGQYLAANPLHPTAMATSVRMRDGKRLVTDGPFAETREQLGGYFLIEAKDLDAAIAVAGRIPMARKGTVEVRPIFEIPVLPSDLTIPRGHPRPISIIRQPPFAMRKALSDERCRFCSCSFDSQCIDELL